MKKPLLIVGLLASIIYACNQQDHRPTHLLTTGKLPSQVFSIDITRDTTLHTKNGALIRIPHGALSSANNTVQLEIKEAYSMQDILKGGLTTMSNGQPLSSGGMIYVNAVGDSKVKFNQPISIAIPTPFLDSNMQLFKGAVQSDSTINWVDPKPLPANPQLTALQIGETIFNGNCASCHSLDKDLTGPALAHIMKRVLPYTGEGGAITHPYTFTRNPARVMHDNGYYRCLKNKFGGVVMTSFDGLTDKDYDNLYAYIENESERRNLPIPDDDLMKCADSCHLYLQASTHWKEVKARLEAEAVNMVEEIRNYSDTAIDTTNIPISISDSFDPGPALPQLDVVNPNSNRSLYYQFTIQSFDWYNVDVLIKDIDGVKESNLMVQVQNASTEKFSLYLIIPSVRVLMAGGPLKNQQNVYGFKWEDGSILLPQNVTAYIIAFGERDDQMIFAKKIFTTSPKQSFDLSLATITREAFQQEIANLQLSDLTIQGKDTKNAAAMREAVKELKNAEQLKPRHCDCDCFLGDAPPKDSIPTK